ncbi:hypothetical protein VTN96DRAFT_7501 [Rasamsonia emersonii]
MLRDMSNSYPAAFSPSAAMSEPAAQRAIGIGGMEELTDSGGQFENSGLKCVQPALQ